MAERATSRVAACLMGALALGGVSESASAHAWAQDPSAPQGRPPLPPLYRGNPRIVEVKFSVSMLFTSGDRAQPDAMLLTQHAVEIPLTTSDSLSQVDVLSTKGSVMLAGDEMKTVQAAMPIKSEPQPDGTTLLVIDVGAFKGQHSRFDFTWLQQVWESRLDETAAAQISWPREWPEEAARALKPEPFIESDAPAFAQFVQKVTGGQSPRSVPVQTAAKELIRGAIGLFRNVGQGEMNGNAGVFRGFSLQGALAAANSGTGSPHDLVCACVATLRAAGIPARPVVGVIDVAGSKGGVRFASWGEYFLPGAGWVPFDPERLRGSGVRSLAIDRDWPGHGEIDFDDGMRIPLAHSFLPPGKSTAAIQYPALWGWRSAGAIMPQSSVIDTVEVHVTSRGKGTPD